MGRQSGCFLSLLGVAELIVEGPFVRQTTQGPASRREKQLLRTVFTDLVLGLIAFIRMRHSLLLGARQMDAIRRSAHLETYRTDRQSTDLVLTVNEPSHPAWFSASVYPDPEAAAYGIDRFWIAVEVGLRDDTATYPCSFMIDAASFRVLKNTALSWGELIAQGIQATVFGFPQFADLLRQRAFVLGANAC